MRAARGVHYNLMMSIEEKYVMSTPESVAAAASSEVQSESAARKVGDLTIEEFELLISEIVRREVSNPRPILSSKGLQDIAPGSLGGLKPGAPEFIKRSDFYLDDE